MSRTSLAEQVKRSPPRARLLAIVFLLSAALGALSAGCGPAPPPSGEGPGHRPQRLALTPQEELQVGREAYREVLTKYRGRILPADSTPVKRARQVTARIVRAAGIEPLQREINLRLKGYRFEWEVNVLEDRQVNAFCLPGGKIGVYTGMFRVVEDDDQLATVLAHEISHALAHHSSERIARAEELRGKPGLAAFLLGKAYDREQEAEADKIGVFLMTFAGYDPHEAVDFWRRMQQLHAGGEPPEILSDHPSSARRVEAMKDYVRRALAAKRAFDQGRIAPPRDH
jgi:predicted Zn-dependent protease